MLKGVAECSAILPTCIKLPTVFKTFILSIFEWPLKTGLTVQASSQEKKLSLRVSVQIGHRLATKRLEIWELETSGIEGPGSATIK